MRRALVPRRPGWSKIEWSLGACVAFAALACNPGTSEEHSGRRRAPTPEATSSEQAALLPARASAAVSSEGAASSARSPEALAERRAAAPSPSEHVPQTLAFTRHRFAYLADGEVVVRRSDDFGEAARFAALDARNVVSIVGSGFLALARDHVHRVSALDRTSQRLPRAPRLGVTTLWPNARESRQLWLQYEGIGALVAFDLAQANELLLVPRGFVPLGAHDRRALVVLGDGSVVYSTERGLARRTPGGAEQHFALPEIAGRLWRLLPASRPEQVWALTPDQALRFVLVPVLELAERVSVPRGTLAAESEGTRLAWLVGDDPAGGPFRVEVRRQGEPEPTVVRDVAPRATSAALGRYPSEVQLAPGSALVAVGIGSSVSVYDYRRGTRRFQAERVAARPENAD